MKKRTYFRIELSDTATSVCDTVALLAAKANGGRKITIDQLKAVVDANAIQYPTLNEGVSAELIGGTRLHIDRKIGEDYVTVCTIEEVEVLELEDENETDDIPENLFAQ